MTSLSSTTVNASQRLEILHNQIFSYFVVASSTGFELVWRKGWSLMGILYICVRYIGILSSVINILAAYSKSPISLVDRGRIWTPVIVNVMLGIIMMARIHAMYQRSTKMLIFLLVVFLGSMIATGVLAAIGSSHVSGARGLRLNVKTWIPTFVWETLALCLTIWSVIQHFLELRRSPTGSTTGDCLAVLIKSHVLYFVGIAAVSFFNIGSLAPQNVYSTGTQMYFGVLQIIQPIQMFVLGPRLIMSVRDYHARLVARSDEGLCMTSIAFEAFGSLSTGGDV
ncbi:hypothetical protein EV702DRAFT_1044750 [Suillus placidus]|uniref:Uncharacterized protein n=1 Tax=Suillus placidus TaxID=48579 RepID=A0A9P6ZWK6_9AGAM|nr:hypothetical protein EV702DRAFT_1044750 [Suillus placidus]